MKKKAIDIKKGEAIIVGGKKWNVLEVEISDIGKQGTKKVRLVIESNGERVTIIRPAEYPADMQ